MFTSRMFDMWSSVTSKLEAHSQIQTNIQTTTSLQNSSSGSIKGKGFVCINHLIRSWSKLVINNLFKNKPIVKGIECANELLEKLYYNYGHLS